MKCLVLWMLTAAGALAANVPASTHTLTFSNRLGRVFANVRIEKIDGGFITWVSATNEFVFGRCPVSLLTRETYLQLGVTDSQFSDALSASAKAEHEAAAGVKASAQPEVAVSRKAVLLSGRVLLGMTPAEVERALGAPDKKNRSVYESGTHEQWVYGDRYVFLREDKVTSWQESE